MTVAKVAYILQIHKNPCQVNKFIKQLIYEEHADVFVHIDKKQDELKNQIIKSPNVKILKQRIDVKWGDITQVDATLLLLKEVLASGINYDFICFRSGQDLLVKNGFGEFLGKNKNKIFMNAYRVKRREPHASFVDLKWPEWARRLYVQPYHPLRLLRRGMAALYSLGWNIKPNRNSLPKDYSIYNGSNWFCIPLNAAKYLLNFLDKNQWYYDAYKDSLVPDEFFFQTLIMNSKYKENVVNDNLMYIKFGESIKTRNNPITLTMEHVEIIKKSNEYFARKFDESIDQLVIDYFSEQVRM
ncbi:beta-1,6-N-acetylglucosaminyltransferase [Neobacillus muris]|uniref:beta-1,6-N-acetylglucosaminyltransferase n=1 Tax=Neobacillus muris TaxID=2941334 RepID=UPI00203EBE34|nr:beta-1,6-N-acetylglucosaminyltransferase [Neobacillus muris]